MWRDLALDSFISLTQHFITNDGDLIKLVPFCEYFGKRKHTGLNIKISLADMLKALGLEDEKYDKNVVLDNARNNKCAIRLSPGLKGHCCGRQCRPQLLVLRQQPQAALHPGSGEKRYIGFL